MTDAPKTGPILFDLDDDPLEQHNLAGQADVADECTDDDRNHQCGERRDKAAEHRRQHGCGTHKGQTRSDVFGGLGCIGCIRSPAECHFRRTCHHPSVSHRHRKR